MMVSMMVLMNARIQRWAFLLMKWGVQTLKKMLMEMVLTTMKTAVLTLLLIP